MKTILIAGLASMVLVGMAQAHDVNSLPRNDTDACHDTGMAARRVSFSLPRGPLCCADAARCTQFLSTTTIARAHPDLRT